MPVRSQASSKTDFTRKMCGGPRGQAGPRDAVRTWRLQQRRRRSGRAAVLHLLKALRIEAKVGDRERRR